MKHRILRQAAVGFGALGLLLPSQAVFAAPPGSSAPAIPGFEVPLISDIALGAGGTLAGQVVNEAGQGVSGIPVAVRHNETNVATATSGLDGKFVVSGLQGGIFQVSAGQGIEIYRLWAPETAPPAAGSSALIVHNGVTVRGQVSSIGKFLANPLLIAGIVAVAVAVPIAVHQYREDHKSGS
jgi:hypothetical protein